MTRRNFYSPWLWATALSALIPAAYGQTGSHAREDARLITATQVLEELRQTPDQNVPDWIMQRAYGVAVIPEVIKGAFMFGGRYGNGVLTVRDAASGHFSNPIFITLVGGSVGWQIGATSTTSCWYSSRPAASRILRAANSRWVPTPRSPPGPWTTGRAAAGINAEIYSYSRARGLFAGVALDGTALAFDRTATNCSTTMKRHHGRDHQRKDTSNAESARHFLAAVAVSANGAAPAPLAQRLRPRRRPLLRQPRPAMPPAASGVRTFPTEDSKPASPPQ